jgi:hypothetical protein
MLKLLSIGRETRMALAVRHNEGMVMEFFQNGERKPYIRQPIEDIPTEFLRALNYAFGHEKSAEFTEPLIHLSGDIRFHRGNNRAESYYTIKLCFELEEAIVAVDYFDVPNIVYYINSFFNDDEEANVMLAIPVAA